MKQRPTLQHKSVRLLSVLLISFLIFQLISMLCFNLQFHKIRDTVSLQNQYTAFEPALIALQQEATVCFDELSVSSLPQLQTDCQALSDQAQLIHDAFPGAQLQDTLLLTESYAKAIALLSESIAQGMQDFSQYRECTRLYNLLTVQYPTTFSAENALLTEKMNLIFSNWNLFNIFLVLMICLVFLIFLLGAMDYVQKTVYPLSLLVQYTCELENGIYHEENSGLMTSAIYSELFILANAFVRMERTIRSQISALEDKISLSKKVHTLEMEKLAAQVALSQTENSLMQSLINPHFLFNCLNLLSSFAIIEKAPTVHQYSLKIADYLRSSLNYNGKHIALKKEFSLINQYADIQKIRFGQRISFSFCCDEDCETAEVPAIILQPLVENSLVHGVGSYLENGQVCVRASRSPNGHIVITAEDNGCGMTLEQVQAIMQSLHQPFKPGQKGTGLRSVFYRLDYFFDGETDFSIESRPGQTRIVITIPYRVNEEKNDNFTEKC